MLCMGQSLLKGTVLDEKNTPIPLAKVYVKNDAEMRTLTDANGYYELRLFPGEYFLVFNAVGYEERESYISIGNDVLELQRDIQLFPLKLMEIESVKITAKKSNPGREIILKVVERRDRMSPWNYAHTVDAYIKATEKITRKNAAQKQKASDETPETPEDPFEEEKKKQRALANDMNLVEVQLNRAFAPPNKVKEVRNAYEKRGDDLNLYYTTTVKSNFNFFQNLMHLNDLHQSPVSSPISIPGILSYKYRLEEQYEENGKKISRIKIIPRSIATTTLEGYIWVVDSTWLVQKLELTLNKGNLLRYDYFTVRQVFDHIGDTLCVLKSQELSYGVKYKDQSSTCKTIADFSNYVFNATFSKKFFGDELAVTAQTAYEQDTSFWNKKRVISLTPEEKAYILAKDSIRDAQNRKEYLDSVDAIFNKVTFWKVVWFGVDHRNRPNKSQWTISSMAGLLRPLYIAGPRIAPNFSYFKKWKDERTLDCYNELSYGFLNKDIKGRTWWKYRYNPFHFGTLTFTLANDFDAIRSYDAITQIYQRSNFIEKTVMRLGNSYELFNGFYVRTDLEYSERRSIKDYKFLSLFDSVLPNNNPTDFQPYNALLAEINISYTPHQKFMREPRRKVLLGSNYPTFYMTYERGIPKLFNSIIDHEYLRVGILQTFKIGTLGTSSYHVTSAKFLSSKNLLAADFKFQRRSDPIWFSNPLYSFQGLDSSLPSKDIFFEAHFVHHDNGAIINKLPFMKKTGIGLVFGAGALYVKEFNWQHYEVLAGLERNFKFSKRRLRIGIYVTASDGNKINSHVNYKISFAVLDDRSMKWNF